MRMDRSRSAVSRRAVLGGLVGATFLFSLPARATPLGERRLALENPNTGESFSDVYWCDGDFVPDSLRRIEWLMRDFHCDEVAPIDHSLIDLLHELCATLATARPVQILSGYRTPATNRLLRGEGLHPASNSLHLVGQAVDVRIEKVPLGRLHRAAVSLRAGGVGTYRRAHFVHLDCGPVRQWQDLRRRPRR
jgi:uncharacterized protein YcbK (DUF882 family)